jgi:uncharacterized repeat protein (TIGR03803 family)
MRTFVYRSLPFASLLAPSILEVVAAAAPAQAATQRVLYNFSGGTDGGSPFYNTLLRDKHGNFYATTVSGGQYGAGTVFVLTPKGEEIVLYDFTGGADGAQPCVGVISDAKGNLYGTTYSGGAHNAGTVFKLAPDGTQSVLYSFGEAAGDPAQSLAGLVMDDKGNLYGTGFSGGASNAGAVFKVTRKGKETVLHSFAAGGDGAQPLGDLIRDDKGNLYGTTYSGGANGAGAVFKITPGGDERVLHSFGAAGDGTSPYSGLVRDSDGNFYGAAGAGGAHGAGAVFKIAKKGKESVLYSFGPGDGAQPIGGLLLSADGNLYGTNYSAGAYGAGAVFKVTLLGQETVLYSFGPGDGAQPRGRLFEDSKGNLYGTTEGGGTYGAGTVFTVKNSSLGVFGPTRRLPLSPEAAARFRASLSVVEAAPVLRR